MVDTESRELSGRRSDARIVAGKLIQRKEHVKPQCIVATEVLTLRIKVHARMCAVRFVDGHLQRTSPIAGNHDG